MKISSEPTRLQSIMFSLNMFLFMLAVTLLTVTGQCPFYSTPSSREAKRNIHSYDMTRPQLTGLYNSPVYRAERMKTRLGSSSSTSGPFSHTGVRVTLADGSRWLIHKGCNFGISSDTVVVDADYMRNSDWEVEKYQDFNGRKTVADFVRTGGSDYNLFFDNCHYASRRMINQ